MSLATEIEKYLKAAKVPAHDLARAFQASHDLVLYGETHVELPKKAEFFAKMIRAGQVQYHASEHFDNTTSMGATVERYMTGKLPKPKLPADLRPLTPVLDAIGAARTSRGLVFSGSLESNGERRHARIHANFTSSRSLHLKAGRFGASAKGHFHIGAFHAARLPEVGSTKTTTQRLIADGFDVGVVRLMADSPGRKAPKQPAWGLSFVADELSEVEPVAGGAPIDLLPLLRKVAAGNPFGVDLKKAGNPFWKVRSAGLTSTKAWPDYYDKLIFLA